VSSGSGAGDPLPLPSFARPAFVYEQVATLLCEPL
jgi:hypothetical protein